MADEQKELIGKLAEMAENGQLLIQGVDSTVIPVPIERYEELLRKEVELDLIYGVKSTDCDYRLSDLIGGLMKLRGYRGGADA